MRPKKGVDKEYCEKYPVRSTVWGTLKDPHNRVGLYADQYETLQKFVDDVWLNYLNIT